MCQKSTFVTAYAWGAASIKKYYLFYSAICMYLSPALDPNFCLVLPAPRRLTMFIKHNGYSWHSTQTSRIFSPKMCVFRGK